MSSEAYMKKLERHLGALKTRSDGTLALALQTRTNFDVRFNYSLHLDAL